MKSQRETTEEGMAMTQRMFGLFLVVLFLALAPAAMASNTWYVDGVNGNDNNNCKSPQTACKTIGHAISLASSGDSIMVAAATYSESLSIGFSLKVIGSGAATTIVDGGGGNQVVAISKATHVTLSGLTIRNGSAPLGGGIGNSGTLTIIDSTVSGNTAQGSCGKYCLPAGGGIYNRGRLTVSHSTISGNNGAWGGGGILVVKSGTLVVNNSTISGNSSRYGGGMCIFPESGTVTVNNSTISGNSSYVGSGAFIDGGTVTVNNSTISGNNGRGIDLERGTVTLQNTIVANTTSGGDCYGTITSNGYNLSSDGTCNFNGPGDLNNTDPKLGTLGNHGGPTQTIPLLAGSPAIDAGNPGGCTDGNGHLLKTDQRGYPRPDKEDKSGCDMGAYERQED